MTKRPAYKLGQFVSYNRADHPYMGTIRAVIHRENEFQYEMSGNDTDPAPVVSETAIVQAYRPVKKSGPRKVKTQAKPKAKDAKVAA